MASVLSFASPRLGGSQMFMPETRQVRLKIQAKLRGQMFNVGRMKRSIDDMAQRSLYNAGYAVKQAAKKGIGNRPPSQTKKGLKDIKAGALVELNGGIYADITMSGRSRPRPPGKPILSHAPKRFMYYSIIDYPSRSTFGPTVVIGAYKAIWLARLHEFGGTTRLTAWTLGQGAARNAYLRRRGNGRQGRDERGRYTSMLPQRNQFDYGVLVWSQAKPRGKQWQQGGTSKIAHYPARPFMQGAAGVQKAAAKANLKFRNMLRKAG